MNAAARRMKRNIRMDERDIPRYERNITVAGRNSKQDEHDKHAG